MVTLVLVLCLLVAIFAGFLTNLIDRHVLKNRALFANSTEHYRMAERIEREEYDKTKATRNAEIANLDKKIQQHTDMVENLNEKIVELQNLEVRAAERLKMVNSLPYFGTRKEWRNR